MKKLLTLCFLVAILFNAKAQNLIRFESDGWMGFKNTQGEIVIPAKIYYPDNFKDGVVTTSIDDKYGAIDINGKIVIPFKYDYITDFYKGYAAVQVNNTVSIIDLTGKEVKKLKYTKLGWHREDIVNVALDNKYGRINVTTGEEIISPMYESMPRFYTDEYGFLTRVQLNGKWGFIDKLGKIILPIEYDGATYSQHRLQVTKNGEDFYFDKTGKPIIKTQ